VPYFKPGKELKDLINREAGESIETSGNPAHLPGAAAL
jgi:hypothetical protein